MIPASRSPTSVASVRTARTTSASSRASRHRSGSRGCGGSSPVLGNAKCGSEPEVHGRPRRLHVDHRPRVRTGRAAERRAARRRELARARDQRGARRGRLRARVQPRDEGVLDGRRRRSDPDVDHISRDRLCGARSGRSCRRLRRRRSLRTSCLCFRPSRRRQSVGVGPRARPRLTWLVRVARTSVHRVERRVEEAERRDGDVADADREERRPDPHGSDDDAAEQHAERDRSPRAGPSSLRTHGREGLPARARTGASRAGG